MRYGTSVLPLLLFAASCTEKDTGHAQPRDTGLGDASVQDAGGAAMPDRTAFPPPVSGGTLLVTRDGTRAVASDPDADRVVVVGMDDMPDCAGCAETPAVLHVARLAKGEEPGRLAEDGAGHVHVVLRRGGAFATIDLRTGELLARRPVCAAPRGIAYDANSDVLHVACASGALVTVDPLSGEVKRRVELGVDLRDVVVVPQGLVVSRFKTAELLRLDRDGNVVERIAPTAIVRGPQNLAAPRDDPMEPAVAWRAVGTQDGSVVVLHQYDLARPIDLGTAGAPAPPTPYGVSAQSACSGIVTPAVSVLPPDGALQMGLPVPAHALSVDVGASSDGTWVAVAHTGALGDRVTVYRTAKLPTLNRSPVGCADDEGRLIVDDQPIAVAFVPGRTPAAASDRDWLVVQTRAPSVLSFYRGFSSARIRVSLGAPYALQPGHELFHLDAGNGIACAQCHVEGAEDGRVWQFLPLGNRRTQAIDVGLDGTEPFHWSGDLPNFHELVAEVLVRRMGGAMPDQYDEEQLRQWVFSLRPPAPIVAPDDDAAQRGKALFESPGVGCADCHAGPKATNEDVGVESPAKFQIPSLRGVGYRAPFLHNGCAATLRDRFDPACGGGDRHGKTSQLSTSDVDDLVAYLNSL
jgi:mono/diheme cytochrome c family protein